MKFNDRLITRKDGVVTQEVDKEILVYDLGKNKAYCLNETSAIVYQMCDGERSVSEITEKVSSKLRKPVSEDLVWLAIDQLQKEQLVDTGVVAGERFVGLDRREVLRKIGLASIVALPLITGVIAPPAAHAASGCTPAACACSGPDNTTITSCAPGVGVCGSGCSQCVVTPGTCSPDGGGGQNCAGTCGA